MGDTDSVVKLQEKLDADSAARARWDEDPVGEATALGFTDIAADLQTAMKAALSLADQADAGTEITDVEQALLGAGCADWLAPIIAASLEGDADDDIEGHTFDLPSRSSATVGLFNDGLAIFVLADGEVKRGRAQAGVQGRLAGLRETVRRNRRPRY